MAAPEKGFESAAADPDRMITRPPPIAAPLTAHTALLPVFITTGCGITRMLPVRRGSPPPDASGGPSVPFGFGVRVGLGVAVGFGVLLGFGVAVGFGVFVAFGVAVGFGVFVAFGVAVGDGVLVAFGVAAGLGVLVGFGVASGRGVGLGRGEGVGVGGGGVFSSRWTVTPYICFVFPSSAVTVISKRVSLPPAPRFFRLTEYLAPPKAWSS